jgi:nitrous oxidase accessory protein NosD
MGDKDGAIIVAAGENTQVTGTDCHFTNNTVGMGAREKASLSLTTCTFKGNALDSRSSGLVVLRDAQVAVRKTALVDASPYAVNVMSNGALTLEDAEISGSRGAGLVVGERNASPARAEIKRSRFYRNAIAIGVVAGSSAEIEDSDCRENKEGILVLEQGSRLKLKKTTILYNREHGLHVYANAEATVTDSEIRNNGRGAQSGVPHKASQRAVLTLEDCRIGGNQFFGVGACAQSQLILNRCVFDEESKKNIYRESGAIVQSDTGSELTPSPQEAAEATPSPESTPKTKSSSRRTTRTRPRQQDEDAARDISRIIRQWVPHP